MGGLEALGLLEVFSHVNQIVTSRWRTLFLCVIVTQMEIALPSNGRVINEVSLFPDGGLSSLKEVCRCCLAWPEGNVSIRQSGMPVVPYTQCCKMSYYYCSNLYDVKRLPSLLSLEVHPADGVIDSIVSPVI